MRAAKTKGTTGAILSLLSVQTELEVCADTGKFVTSTDATRLARQIEAARDMLQAAILEAGRILEEGV